MENFKYNLFVLVKQDGSLLFASNDIGKVELEQRKYNGIFTKISVIERTDIYIY